MENEWMKLVNCWSWLPIPWPFSMNQLHQPSQHPGNWSIFSWHFAHGASRSRDAFVIGQSQLSHVILVRQPDSSRQFGTYRFRGLLTQYFSLPAAMILRCTQSIYWNSQHHCHWHCTFRYQFHSPTMFLRIHWDRSNTSAADHHKLNCLLTCIEC